MSKVNLRKAALEATTLSELMEGRTPIKTEDVIKKNNGVLTINGCDVINTADAHYCVVTAQEYKDNFYTGGMVLTKIVDKWISLYDGDMDALNADLMSEPVQVQLSEGKTKNNRNLTTVVVL